MGIIFGILLAILYFKFGYRLISSAKISIAITLSIIVISFLFFGLLLALWD